MVFPVIVSYGVIWCVLDYIATFEKSAEQKSFIVKIRQSYIVKNFTIL